MIDITPIHLATIKRILAEHVPDCEVRAFGSRVTWTAKDYSDLDLAVVGARALDADTLRRLKEAFEESDLPFRVDVLDWHGISTSFRRVIEKNFEVIQNSTKKSRGMTGGWIQTTLGSIAAKDGFGLVDGPFGSNLPASCYTESGIPIIRGSNLTLGSSRFREDEFVFVSRDMAERLSRSLCRPLDIVFTKKGTLGQTGLVPEGGLYDLYLLSSNQMKLTVDRRLADPLFVYYFASSRESTEKIIRDSEATGVPKTNITYLRDFPIALPPLTEQRAIADILGTLDDKIELNRRMNETLEAMARALFKSWFVDFDPVRAKAEGRDPGLPKPLADLFPARFVDSELGEIPGGWMVTTIGDLARKVAMGPFGSSIKTDNFVSEGVPVIRGGNLTNGFVDNGFVFLLESKADELKNANAFAGDIVITHRGTLGQVGLIPAKSRYRRYVVSQSQMLIRPDPQHLPSHFLYLFLKSPTGQQALLANMSQTGVPAIAQPTISVKSIKLVCPSDSLLSHFEAIAASIFDLMVQRKQQSQTLAALRDTLLPRLVSGELRISGRCGGKSHV